MRKPIITQLQSAYLHDSNITKHAINNNTPSPFGHKMDNIFTDLGINNMQILPNPHNNTVNPPDIPEIYIDTELSAKISKQSSSHLYHVYLPITSTQE